MHLMDNPLFLIFKLRLKSWVANYFGQTILHPQ